MIPVFKKEDEPNKENYRPVSVLSHAYKIFEIIVFSQINLFSNLGFWYYLQEFPKRSAHKMPY